MADLIVIARARVHPGREPEAEAALNANAAESRKEAGCVSYSVLHGLQEPQLFMTYERWRSQADFTAHMSMPYTQALLQAIGALVVAPPEIQLLAEV